MDLEELYKKKHKLNMKVKELGEKLNKKIKELGGKIVKVNKQISQIEYDNMLKANSVTLDGNFNLQVGK